MNDDISSPHRVAAELEPELRPLPEGHRLPSQRDLVRRFGVSATTVAHALALLRQRGLVEVRPGSGAFRAGTRRAAPPGDVQWQEAALELTEGVAEAHGGRRFATTGLSETLSDPGPDVVDLNRGYLHPSLQPLRLLESAMGRAARRPEAWDRPPEGGLPDLRDWFARDIGGGLGRSEVLISGGGQTSLATTLRALARPGDPVVMEAPTYPGTIAAALAAGLRPVSVPVDDEGVVPRHLDEALDRSRARVVVVQPVAQNPTGATMGAARRRAVRDVVRSHDSFLIEDDFARHLVHADAPMPPPPLVADDPDGTVIHLRSLTKATSPNMRVGAIAARGPVMDRLRAAVLVDSLLVAAPLQLTALEVVTSSGWQHALRVLGENLSERRDVATRAVRAALGPEALPSAPRGGYHLWVRLPAGTSGTDFARRALTRGTLVTAGKNYFLPGGNERSHLRLSYVAAPAHHDIETGISRLAPGP